MYVLGKTGIPHIQQTVVLDHSLLLSARMNELLAFLTGTELGGFASLLIKKGCARKCKAGGEGFRIVE